MCFIQKNAFPKPLYFEVSLGCLMGLFFFFFLPDLGSSCDIQGEWCRGFAVSRCRYPWYLCICGMVSMVSRCLCKWGRDARHFEVISHAEIPPQAHLQEFGGQKEHGKQYFPATEVPWDPDRLSLDTMLFSKHLRADTTFVWESCSCYSGGDPRPPLDLMFVETQLLGGNHPRKTVFVVSLWRADGKEGAH